MEHLLMSQKERTRMGVLKQVKAKLLSLVAAGELLRLSYRQAKRVWRRYRDQGDKGLVHRARGRVGNRRKAADIRERPARPPPSPKGATLGDNLERG